MDITKYGYAKRIGFIVPLLAVMTVFILYPFLSSLYYSLTKWDGVSRPVFIGLDNYIRLFDSLGFRHALLNTLFYTVAALLITNPLSMALALLLNTSIKGRLLLRTVFYLPAVMSLVVVSYLWSVILSYDGILNKLLDLAGLGRYAIDWLGNMDKTPWAVFFVLCWTSLGSGMVFYLAGLQAIPKELYESAAIDGVNKWSKFWHITFPMLMPSVTVVTFFGLAGTLKMFDLPFIMTDGGPGDATTTLGMLVYNQAFRDSTFGYATASGIVMFVLVVAASLIQLRLTRSREVEM